MPVAGRRLPPMVWRLEADGGWVADDTGGRRVASGGHRVGGGGLWLASGRTGGRLAASGQLGAMALYICVVP